MSALAVLCALLSGPFPWFEEALCPWLAEQFHNLAWVELGLILAVVALVSWAILWDWHGRWLDFRFLAERLRHHSMLMPIGGVSRMELPSYETGSDLSHRWTDWLVRAIDRAEGIPTGVLGQDFRLGYAKYLFEQVDGQQRYHRSSSVRNGHIAHFIHKFDVALILLILSACIVHIAVECEGCNAHATSTLATLFAAFFPAVGAAAAGLLSQGEFERIASRSHGMVGQLRLIIQQLGFNPREKHDDPIKTINGSPQRLLSAEELEDLAQSSIETMAQELSDWRLIFRSKPPRIPA